MSIRIKSAVIAIACLLLIGNMQTAYSQEYHQVPVKVSAEKVKASDGKVYYSHIVKEKQTLFSISKAYGVTIEAIYAANPTMNLEKEGLKKGSIILIPTDGNIPAEESKVQAVEAVDKNTQPEDNIKNEDSSEEEYLTHTVKWFENIDDIALKYGVPAEVILKYNGLEGKKLKKRQALRIPRNYVPGSSLDSSESPSTEISGQDNSSDNKNGDADNSEQEQPMGWNFGKGNKVKVALVMPFNAKGKADSKSFDFYSGVLLAVNDLKEEGISVDLSTYDCSGGMPLTKERIDACDLIIGPIAHGDIKPVLELGSAKTAIISPLDQRAQSFASVYTNFIQAPSPYSAQYKDIIEWIRSDWESTDNLLVISEKGKTSNGVTALGNVISGSGLPCRNFSYSLLEGRQLATTLAKVMNPNAVNRVILNSESETFVSETLRNLCIMNQQGYKTVLYGPSRIHSFDSIDPANLHELNMHMSMSYYIDYNTDAVREFLLSYRALFNTEPTQFAFQGYDIAKYFIEACSRYGNKWLKKIDEESPEKAAMLQSTFDLVSQGAGHVNNGIRRVVYKPDFTIILTD